MNNLTFDQWFQSQQGKAYYSYYEFAKDAWDHQQEQFKDKLKNAERYEYIRDMDKSDCCMQCGYDALYIKVGEELDEVVDSKMEKVNRNVDQDSLRAMKIDALKQY